MPALLPGAVLRTKALNVSIGRPPSIDTMPEPALEIDRHGGERRGREEQRV